MKKNRTTVRKLGSAGMGGAVLVLLLAQAVALSAPPVALDDQFNGPSGTTEDALRTFNYASDFRTNDVGDGIVLHSVPGSSPRGAVLGRVGQRVTYDPTAAPELQALPSGTTVRDQFTYTIRDSSNQYATATVYLDVSGVNDPPVANDDDRSNLPGELVTRATDELIIDHADLLANDTDVDQGNTISVKRVIPGSVVGDVNNRPGQEEISYDPDGQFVGVGQGETTTDRFAYEIEDLAGETSSANVTVTIEGVNDAPVAQNDSDGNTPGDALVTDEDSDLVIAAGTLLANDYDPDTNDTISISYVTHPDKGTVSERHSGGRLVDVTYRPRNAFQYLGDGDTGYARFRYEIGDQWHGTDMAQVRVTVTGINDPPVLEDSGTNRVYDHRQEAPFQDVELFDVDGGGGGWGEHYRVKVLPNEYGSFTPDTPIQGPATNINSELRKLIYLPTEDLVSTYSPPGRMVTFDVDIEEIGGPTGTTTLAVQLIGRNDRPTIAGVPVSIIRINDDRSVAPFQPVLIGDPDERGEQLVSLAVSFTYDDAAGPPGAFPGQGLARSATTNAAGVVTVEYELGSGTPANMQERLRALVFTPTANRIPVGETETVRMQITVTDFLGLTRVNDLTRVAITSIDTVPVIATDPDPLDQPFLIRPDLPLLPFREMGVHVSDDDTNLTVTVALDDAEKGALLLTNGLLAAAVEFEEFSAGAYRFAGGLAEIAVVFSNLEYRVDGDYPFRPDLPGYTVFAVEVVDSVLNTATRALAIKIQEEPANWMVTRTDDDLEPGSLRYALTRIELNRENGAMVTFALPQYPDIIRLDHALGPLILRRNVAIKGPGADLLTISGDSNGDGLPDTQLFQVFSWVQIEGVTLTKGKAVTGGAVYVGTREIAEDTVQAGHLSLRFCSVTDSLADTWGGAVDVDEGRLTMEHCLLRGNATTVMMGLGGGAVSVFSDLACAFVNTTFSENRQQSPSGYGGGAVYVENHDPRYQLPVEVTHCTFAGNVDVSDRGSALTANVSGTDLRLKNSIFADGLERNLWVLGAGGMTSLDGNLSDDSTRVQITQGGQPDDRIVLDGPNDRTLVDPGLLPLDIWLRPMPAYRLEADSPAIDNGVASVVATDQRGVFRDAQPDAGALEFDAVQRVVLNEVQFDPRPSGAEAAFLEFYVPRDAAALDLADYSVWIDGARTHVFRGGANTLLQPGRGIVVADALIAAGDATFPTPVVTPGNGTVVAYRGANGLRPVTVTAPDHGLADGAAIILSNAAVRAYNDRHAISDVTADTFDIPVAFVGVGSVTGYEGSNGLAPATVLAPEHGLVEGARVTITNAPVAAYNGEHVIAAVADGSFTIDVAYNAFRTIESYSGTTGQVPVTVRITDHGWVEGARVRIKDAPLAAYNDDFTIVNVTNDSFEIPIPYREGDAIHEYSGTTGAPSVTVVSTNHGLADRATIEISGSVPSYYDGIHTEITLLNSNEFAIAATYVGKPLTNGIWTAVDAGTVEIDDSGSSWRPVDAGEWQALLDLEEQGLVELKAPDERVVLSAAYLGRYADLENPERLLDTAFNSITLCPQFRGAAYLPHSVVSWEPLGGADLASLTTTTNTSSPGADTKPQAFGSPNASPLAIPDEIVVSEDEWTEVPVLDNDFDADGLDRLVIVDVSTPGGDGPDDPQTSSLLGADVRVVPGTVPDPGADPLLRGSAVSYDPRYTPGLQSLPEGAKTTDRFMYSVVDIGTGPILAYTNSGGDAAVISPAHRLASGTEIVVSGCSETSYNGTHAVTRVDDDVFSIPVPFAGVPATGGVWETRNQREPTRRSEGEVVLTVLGVNDPPVPVTDTITNVNEHKVVRIMGMPDLAGSTTAVFTTDSDYPMVPEILTQNLLENDLDPDVDDGGVSLRIIGVASNLNAVEDFSGTVGQVPVTVVSTNHGLTAGNTVLISGYGGHSSYNGLHSVTVIDDDAFSIPVKFADNSAPKGMWALLEDTNRLVTVSRFGADVHLEIRADPRETSIVYDPNPSAYLNGLAAREMAADTFYYAVMDRHGGAAFARVTVLVEGLNDMPIVSNDPAALALLAPFLGTQTVEDVLLDLNVCYSRPAESGGLGLFDMRVTYSNDGVVGSALLPDMWMTGEEIPLLIAEGDVLANDTDVDRLDVPRLRIAGLSPVSHHGAAVSLNGARSISYDPRGATRLNSLARDEVIFDWVDVAVSDQAAGVPGVVTQIVVVAVIGAGDKPRAFDDFETTTEDDVLFLPSPSLTGNDEEDDIDGNDPDDRLQLIQVTNAPTAVEGAGVTVSGLDTSYDPTGSAFLNGLADWMIWTDRYDYVTHDGSYLFAQDDIFEVGLNKTGTVLRVLANDINLNTVSSGMVIRSVCAPGLEGSVTIDPDGETLVYSPAFNFVGEEMFAYTLVDDGGCTDSARVKVRVVVDQWNGYLRAGDDHFSVARGESARLDVLVNDYALPSGGSGLSVTRILSGPDMGGGVSIGGTGLLEYEPAEIPPAPYPYHETVQYEVSGGGTALATGTVDILVINRHGTLEVADDAYAVMAGSWDNALPVLENDFVLPASAEGWTVRSVVPTNTARIDPTGTTLLYSPLDGFVGRDVLEYVAYDGIGGTGTGRVTVTVADVIVCDDAYAVHTNSSTLLPVLTNDRLLPRDPATNVTICGVAPPGAAIGTLSVAAGGRELRFDASGVAGKADFTYGVVSSGGTVSSGSVTIAVLAMPDLVANEDFFHVTRGSSLNELDVLTNDTQFLDDPRPLAVASVGTGLDGPTHGGTVTINQAGDGLAYTPAEGFRGEERFTYTMTDGRRTDTATVVIQVEGGRLRAADDAYTVLYRELAPGEESLTYELTALDNDRVLPDFGQSLVITGVGLDAASTNAPGQRGGVTIGPDGVSLIYAPTNAAMAPVYRERFTYEISDGTYRRAAASVWVTIATRTNAVELGTSDDVFAVAVDSTDNALPVLVNDGHLPGTADAWTITGVTVPPARGTAAVHGSHVLYTPPTGFVGTERFAYAVSDGLGGTGTAEVEVYVGQLPLNDDSFAVLSGSTDNRFDVLANDWVLGRTTVDPVLHDVWGATVGGIVTVAGRQVAYTPNPGYAGPFPYVETFFYSIVDQTAGTATGRVDVSVHEQGADQDAATLHITVLGMNDSPTITGAPREFTITDRQSVHPFRAVTITEVDEHGMEQVTVTVTMEDPTQGVLLDAGVFTNTAPGVHVLAGVTGAEATAAIRGLLFVPTENLLPIGMGHDVRFTIDVDDGRVPIVTDDRTVVTVWPVNDPPAIAGTRSGQRFYHRLTVNPFSTVTLIEVDEMAQQPLGVTVTMVEPAHGGLLNIGVFEWITNGVCRVTNTTAAAATEALREMAFEMSNAVPVDGSTVTHFTLEVDDGVAPPVLDVDTSVVAVNPAGQTLHPTNLVDRGAFGLAVDAIADYAVIGAPNADAQGSQCGTAFVYRRVPGTTNEWEEWQTLQPPAIGAGDRFGRSVSMTEELIAVGAIGDGGTGSVHVFEFDPMLTNQWRELARIVPTNLVAGSAFGLSVSLDGDLLAVGAPSADLSGTGTTAGAVMVFGRHEGGADAWGEIMRWAPDGGGSAEARFGWSVALDSRRLVVGADRFDVDGVETRREGAVFCLERGAAGRSWNVVQTIVAAETNLSAEFGWSVCLEKDLLAIGAPAMAAGGVAKAGRVFLYELSAGGAFLEQAELDRRHDAERRFGHSVAVSGTDRLLVGAPHSGSAPNIGAAYLYQRDPVDPADWDFVEKLGRQAGSPAGLFGTSVALNRGSGVVGAPAKLDDPSNHGYAFFYRFGFNTPPVAVWPIPDQLAEVGQPFSFVLPGGVFLDPDEDDALVIDVSFPDGANGLSFSADTISGTPLTGGVIRVEVAASDLRGGATSTVFRIVTLPGASPARRMWNIEQFGAYAMDAAFRLPLWDGAADPDGDGLSNDREYVFGGNAMVPDRRATAIWLVRDGADLVIGYTRRRNDPALRFKLLASADLTQWVEWSAHVLSEQVVPIDAVYETAILRLAIDQNVLHRYYRVVCDW